MLGLTGLSFRGMQIFATFGNLCSDKDAERFSSLVFLSRN